MLPSRVGLVWYGLVWSDVGSPDGQRGGKANNLYIHIHIYFYIG